MLHPHLGRVGYHVLRHQRLRREAPPPTVAARAERGQVAIGTRRVGLVPQVQELRERTVIHRVRSPGSAVGLISFAAGQAAAQTLGQVMFNANLTYSYNYVAVGAWLLVVLIIATLASILPARSATRISVRDSLAYA